MKTRVILADDHPFVRIGIRNILAKTEDIFVVGEAEDGVTALSLVRQLKPDILLLDMELPGLSGVEVARKIKADGPCTPILVLSAHEDQQYILGMLANGAAGYLVKDEVPDTILKAIRGVAKGERGWVSKRVAARIGVWLQYEKPARLSLTPQEVTLLRMLVFGKQNSEISSILGMSEKTVEQDLEKAISTVKEALANV